MAANEQRDPVKEARELLDGFPEIADAAYNIEHALFADAIERQRHSPFWGHSKKIAQCYARAPELLKTLCDEVDQRTKALRMMVELWDAEHPDDPCGCVGASDDCRRPPTCELCVARLTLAGRINEE